MDTAREILRIAITTGERAYLNLCPHSGGRLSAPGEPAPVSRDGRHLICTLHGAMFRIEDGLCVAGPCEGRYLTPAPVQD